VLAPNTIGLLSRLCSPGIGLSPGAVRPLATKHRPAVALALGVRGRTVSATQMQAGPWQKLLRYLHSEAYMYVHA